MTAQTPPTDRPLTAGDWIEWHGGENPAGDAVVEIKLRNRCTSEEVAAEINWSHGFDNPESRASDIIAYRPARPATSAASEGAFSVDDLAQEIRRVDGNHSLGAGALAEALMPFLAALASPPVSERERELEGADEFLAAELIRDQHGPSYWGKLTDAGREYYIRRCGDAMKRARYARIEALTAQPAGEGK